MHDIRIIKHRSNTMSWDFNNCIQITVVKWNDHIQFIVFPYTENKS